MEKCQRFLIRIWMWLLLFSLPISAFAADEVTLQLLWKNQFEFAGYYIAKEKGFYRDLDLEVQIKEYDSGIDVTKEVLSGKTDFGVGYSTVILYKMNGKDVFLLSAVFQHAPLVLLAKKSPELENITDLKGKRIMSTPYDAGSASLTAMLKSNGVLRDDYTRLDHSFNVDDLITGKTDAMTAYLSNQPFFLEKKGFEYTVFNPKDYGFDFYGDILFTSLWLFERNPQLVERFYKASMRGWKYAFSHIDETVDLILKKYNTQNKSRYSLLYEANVLKQMAYDEGVQFGAMNEDRIRQIAQVYRLLGITQKFGSLENLVYKPSLSPDIDLTSEEKAWLTQHPEIRLGVDPAYPPFEFIGKGGAYLGMASDYLSLLNKRLGIDMSIVSGLTWTQVVEKVKEYEVDALPAVTNTEGRRAYLNFTQPYMTFPFTFWSHKDQPPITGFEDLAGKKLAMVKDYFYVEHVLKNHPDIQPYFVDTPLQALKAVSRGKANAFIANLAVAAYLVQRNNLVDLRMDSDVELKLEGLCYGIRKDWPELVFILDKAIDSISQEKHKEIRDKWVVFGDEKEAKFRKVELTEKEKTWLSDHPVIRVHNELNWPPFNYNKDGVPTGFSIEYMNQLTNRIGIKIKYISGEWGELLDKAFDKKLDVMLNIVKTPERQKRLLYTDTYAKNPNVIIAKKGSSISDTQSLFGKKVAYPEGFFYDEVLKTKFPEIIRVPMKDTLETLKAIQYGKVDAALGELAVVNYLIRENLLTGLDIKGIFDSGNPEIEKLNIAVRNDWPELQSLLKKAMASITEEELQDMKDKWFFDRKTEKEKLKLTYKEKAWLAEHKKLLLGFAAGWAPFEYYDEDEVFSGMTSDFLRILNKRLNVEMVPQKGLTWSEVLDKAKNRELDVISAIVPSEEGSEYLHFTKPYMNLPLMVVTRDEAPYITGIGDLKGKTIAVVKGYVTEDYIKRDFPKQDLLLLDSPAEIMLAVSEGRADALVENMATVEFEKKRLGINNLKTAAATPYTFIISYGVRKDWPELVSILDNSLAAFSDNEKNVIMDKWVNLRFKKQVDWQMIWKIIVGFMVVGGSILTVILIWNRRLGREVSERKQKEKLIMLGAQISQSLTVGGSLKETLQSITEIFVKELNVAFARIWIVDETENVIKLQASSGLHTHIKGAHESLPIGGDTKISRVVSEKQPHISNSIQDDPYIKDKDWAREQRLTSYAGIPMVVEGRSVGALVVFSRDTIQEDTNRTILSIADSIAVAIERNRAEETVLASERKIRGMSESSLDAMIMIDGKANIIFWNPAAERIFGYSAEEVMSRNLHDLVLPPEDRELAYKGIDEFIQTGKGKVIGVVIEHKALRKDGSTFPAEIAVSALQMDNEWYAVGTVRDITDRKKAEEELEQNIEDLERFSSMATGREEKMIDLKEEINQLLEQAGQRKKYTIVE